VGRGLYPIYLPEKAGIKGSEYQPRPYSYIGFYLTGPQSQVLNMPYDQQFFSFPNSSDIVVLACSDPNRLEGSQWEVLAVAVFDPSGEVESLLLRSPMPSQMTCPLTNDVSVP
jgi:hypothetical protein